MFLKKYLALITACLFFFFNVSAQKKDNYLNRWKKIDAFENKGLTKSALAETINIFNLAVASGNDVQQIKAAMYQMKYRNMVEQDDDENNIFYIDTLIARTNAPAKNIFQSIQAGLFHNYLQNHRYRFYNRTKLAEEKSHDISTWSIDKLNSKSSELYKASLKNEPLLKNISLNGLDAILDKGENTRNLRPTLFDLLAHRALEHFTDEENYLTQPAYKFILNDERVFETASSFVQTKFITKDSSSLYYNAILLLQNILQFHLNDKDPAALIDADLIRLNFVNEHGVFNQKDSLYEQALKKMEASYISHPASAQIMYLRADLYYTWGTTYDPFTKKEVQFYIKAAKELCELAISKFPKTEGAIHCQNLLGQIKQPSLEIETEQVNIPGQSFRSLVKYKNITKLYLRVIKTSRNEIKNIAANEYDKTWRLITGLATVKKWNISLPDQQDFQPHATEIKIDELPAGTYLVLASIDPEFSLSKNIIAKKIIYVSNISYIKNNEQELYVLNRDNGLPLKKAEVQLWENTYNYTTRKYEEVKKLKYITDQDGHISLKKQSASTNYLVEVKFANDELFLDDNFNFYDFNSYETHSYKRTLFFTDRSIYRPGQTVFFKGIVINVDSAGRKNSIITGYKTKVLLYDVNNQVAAGIYLKTNEHGSYNGNFKLPQGSLNGMFYILDSASDTRQYFSVEEYKRPRFYTDIKKPEGTYRLNDSINVKGSAKAYAGNNIDGAKVTFRVVRKVRYPVWWGFDSYYTRGKIIAPGNKEEMEITNGETTTNASGEFFINFKAIPDETVDKTSQPVFYYEVSADITDINGETRSSNTSIAIAYQALQLNISLPEKIEPDSLKNIKIISTNLNDLYEKAFVHLTVYKLQSPNRIFRERYWEMPDQFTMSKEEFASSFPFDAYSDEDQMSKWAPGEKLIDINDSTKENGRFETGRQMLTAGWYKINVITKDKYGEDVKAEKYIHVLNSQQSISDDPMVLNVLNNADEPGQKLNYQLQTAFDKIWLIHTISKADRSFHADHRIIDPSHAYQAEINIIEEDRGGIGISYAFIKHNRVYTGNNYFSIPWSNKELNIQYETFRDKILPGSKEQWKIKITGNKADKVAAEALISMYDASLDQFKPHSWNPLQSLWPVLTETINWTKYGFSAEGSEEYNTSMYAELTPKEKSYDDLLFNGWAGQNYYRAEGYDRLGTTTGSYLRSDRSSLPASPAINQIKFTPAKILRQNEGREQIGIYDSVGGQAVVKFKKESQEKNNSTTSFDNLQLRTNFNETAFFFPALTTDADGNIGFSFTIPEALTKWKMMTLAHTKDLAGGYSEKTTITQKPLMVQPNAPRFLREADRMEFSAKVVNLSDSEITGNAQLELFDAATNKPVDGWFKNIFPVQYFTVAAGQSIAIKFPVEIPTSFNSAMSYRIKAISKDGSYSDGEEAALPVLTNRMLVTETFPLNMRNTATKNFRFDKLLNSGNSGSLTNHALTVEYTSNPAWYAVQALPYLMEYPYECAEQTFNRYYANELASFISNSAPKIKAVFEKWKVTDTAALMSNLQKNEELKSALLQETPWVLAAQNESQQKKNISLLFDMVRLASEKENTFNKLKEMQSSNGGFTWFKGGADDRYITQYIITGIGHLIKLNALSSEDKDRLKQVIDKALPYLDAGMKEDYDYLVKHKIKLISNNLSYLSIQYLYMRSFFAENKIYGKAQTAYNYYRSQAQKFWLKNNKYMQAMIALSLFRTGDDKTPVAIIKSLKENAIYKEEMGMYWKDFTGGGYYWYQAPVESQAMMIEAFTDIDKDAVTIDDLKTWLLKQKQTQNWKTTKATAEACYALLLNGSNWLAEEKNVSINLGNTEIKSNSILSEAGTGYFKQTIAGDKVQQGMGNISVKISTAPNKTNSSSTSWGAVYWQYFEDLDKITAAETPLKLTKKLFIEKNADRGPVLQALNDGDELHVGDKVKVRIELRVDRDMEYIHMKDMRAACMEPLNVISEYKWQDGLGYYETTKDASSNFFFQWLPRGTYVFEYPLFVTHAGNFSNGITTIQCMYAPEFSSHSDGIRVNVE